MRLELTTCTLPASDGFVYSLRRRMATGAGSYRIAIDLGSSAHKLCRIFFGPDGSYNVMSPYHPAKRALCAVATVNYSRSEQWIKWEDAVDLATLDDEGACPKLAHHPSGFFNCPAKELFQVRILTALPKALAFCHGRSCIPQQVPLLG